MSTKQNEAQVEFTYLALITSTYQ